MRGGGQLCYIMMVEQNMRGGALKIFIIAHIGVWFTGIAIKIFIKHWCCKDISENINEDENNDDPLKWLSDRW